MSGGWNEIAAAGEVGQADQLTADRRGDGFAVRRKRHAEDTVEFLFQTPLFLPCRGVEKDQATVDAGRDERRAVRREGNLGEALFPSVFIRPLWRGNS